MYRVCYTIQDLSCKIVNPGGDAWRRQACPLAANVGCLFFIARGI